VAAVPCQNPVVPTQNSKKIKLPKVAPISILKHSWAVLECIHAPPREIGPRRPVPAKLAQNNALQQAKKVIFGVSLVLGVKNENGEKMSKERPPGECSMCLNRSRSVEFLSQTAASAERGAGARFGCGNNGFA
jgi:hypothetical protein